MLFRPCFSVEIDQLAAKPVHVPIEGTHSVTCVLFKFNFFEHVILILPFDFAVFRIHTLDFSLRNHSTDRLQSKIFVFFLFLVPVIIFFFFIISFCILAEQTTFYHLSHGALDPQKTAYDFLS